MIKEVTYYDIICDRCGKSLTNESETCYPDKDSALMVAEQSEWIDINGKHYCPDCYELDEVTDKYKPKKGGEMKIEEQVNGSVPKKDVLLLLPGIKNYDKLLDDYRWAVQNVPNYRPLHEILELLLFEESYCGGFDVDRTGLYNRQYSFDVYSDGTAEYMGLCKC